MPGLGKGGKRRGWDWSSINPLHRKAKVRRAAKLLRKLPTVGELAEAAQTTDNLFGIGISFGPIIGMAQDFMTGTVRHIAGQRVTIDMPECPVDVYSSHILSGMKAASRIWFGGQEFDDELHRDSIFAFCVGQVHLNMKGVNYRTTYDCVSDWTKVEREAPAPTRLDTRLMLEDEGFNIEQHRGFPPTGNRWVGYEEDAEASVEAFSRNFTPWALRNSKNYGGFIASQFMSKHAEYFGSFAEGRDNFETSLSDEAMVAMHSLRRNFIPKPATSNAQLKEYCNMCVRYKADTGTLPERRRAKWFGSQVGIEWQDQLPVKFEGIAREIWGDIDEELEAGGYRGSYDW
ncbi:hypothetical protein ES702_07337 [subsurface metagenome]